MYTGKLDSGDAQHGTVGRHLRVGYVGPVGVPLMETLDYSLYKHAGSAQSRQAIMHLLPGGDCQVGFCTGVQQEGQDRSIKLRGHPHEMRYRVTLFIRPKRNGERMRLLRSWVPSWRV
jgi:hypothetical protein